ncbi:MAG: hypothetical protein H7832_13250 [Magnetococcus sp. DMHC-6]
MFTPQLTNQTLPYLNEVSRYVEQIGQMEKSDSTPQITGEIHLLYQEAAAKGIDPFILRIMVREKRIFTAIDRLFTPPNNHRMK